MQKAVREAKVNSSWTAPDPGYERDLADFVAAVLDPGHAEFLAELDELARAVGEIGARSSLALLVLKLAAPGVPDVYWGNELPDLSLVDPDNRRPVDFAAHARMLEAVEQGTGESVDKLVVTQRGLHLRRRDPDLFAHGAYIPVEAAGSRAAHVVTFARVHDGRWVVAAVPRLTAGLDGWGDTRLVLPAEAPAVWRNVLTDAEVSGPAPTAAELFEPLPVALLAGGPALPTSAGTPR
jgi:(1->4)-alpha-D-glucan 1-alpha-D-glucosylmutase